MVSPEDKARFKDYDREMLICKILQQENELKKCYGKTLEKYVQDMIDASIDATFGR